MSIQGPLLRPFARSAWICDRCISKLLPKPQQVSPAQRRSLSRNHARKIIIADEEWQNRKRDIEAGRAKSMLETLEERGYVNQVVGNRDDLNKMLTNQRVGVYVGVDPTAPSLHVGHLVPFMALAWMYVYGYSAVYLLGGFTASIGDPIGRLTGRKSQSTSERNTNSHSMHLQLKQLSASIHQYAHRKGIEREWAWRRSVKNNYHWWQNLTMNDFLKTMGVGTRIGPMLGRDTVKNRLENGEGMSFAEFTYPLVQAWDWWHLYKEGVRIQIGGADQFGNILAGAEAVKHMVNNDPSWISSQAATSIETATPQFNDPMGFTVPLLTTSSGEKFGKSAGNAVWLDQHMTSSFDLYQFFLRSTDADVEKYLKLFTFLSMPEIAALMDEHQKAPEKRVAQHKLAYEFVELAHGVSAANKASEQHKAMYNKSSTIANLYDIIRNSQPADSAASNATKPTQRPDDINPLLNKHAAPLDMHTSGPTSIKLPSSLVIQQPLSRILWSSGLVASRSEGQRLINNCGVYIGGRGGKGGPQPMGDTLTYTKIDDPKWSTVNQFVIDNNVLILRTGKWRVKIIEIVPDEEFTRLGLDCPGWREFLNEGQEDLQVEKGEEEGEGDGTAPMVSNEGKAEGKAEDEQLTRLDLHGEEIYRKKQDERRRLEQSREQTRLRRERHAVRLAEQRKEQVESGRHQGEERSSGGFFRR